MRKIIALILILSVTLESRAATYTATAAGGEWTDPATWVGGVVPPSAGGGDVVVIPAGSTVTITNQTVTFNGTVDVYGTLSLDGFFAALDLGTGSVVNVYAGGQVTSSFFFNRIGIGSNPFAYWALFDGNTVSGPATISEASGVQPIELIFFNAKANGSIVELAWATASEENFDYFALERSADGEHFVEIAQINGVGNSNTRQDYDFVDEFPLSGRSYYRLRSVDFDGYTEVFDYVMVEVDEQPADFVVYPNPVTDGQFAIQTNFEITGEATLTVFDSMGSIKMTLPVNAWQQSYDVSGLERGTYIVRLMHGRQVVTKRILVY